METLFSDVIVTQLESSHASIGIGTFESASGTLLGRIQSPFMMTRSITFLTLPFPFVLLTIYFYVYCK